MGAFTSFIVPFVKRHAEPPLDRAKLIFQWFPLIKLSLITFIMKAPFDVLNNFKSYQ